MSTPDRTHHIDEVMSSQPDEQSDSNDSIILDDENPNFTTNIKNMKGAKYPKKVQDYIKENLIVPPGHGVNLTNLSSTKTGFTCSENFKDFEFKKENLMELLKAHGKVAEYKATTKGKFNEHIAQGPADNFSRDIGWIKKANPEAAIAEKQYMDRDLFLMEKRRFQKIV